MAVTKFVAYPHVLVLKTPTKFCVGAEIQRYKYIRRAHWRSVRFANSAALHTKKKVHSDVGLAEVSQGDVLHCAYDVHEYKADFTHVLAAEESYPRRYKFTQTLGINLIDVRGYWVQLCCEKGLKRSSK